ncbi:uncharacterized protein LOC129914506 [Episyrphus balteatus]|uniref:uncharacterized protein LOC129914506 n=1 Tax=Episyrphus balteatus TaxID=286459 RepID=UPI002485A1CF|nr:uncharacterized protein LOC129914506 [Episyrphus balteatus]
MFTVQLCTVLIGILNIAEALDYNFLVPEEGAVACDGSEDKFLDAFFDLSNINWKYFDDETIILNGYVTYLKEIDASLHLHIQVQRYDSGRWIETPYQNDRQDVCTTLFDKNEMWYEFVKELEENSKSCPPEKGTRYDFKEKKVSTLIKDLPPGLDGTYRALIKLFIADDLIFCMNVEGDLVKKSVDNKTIG